MIFQGSERIPAFHFWGDVKFVVVMFFTTHCYLFVTGKLNVDICLKRCITVNEHISVGQQEKKEPFR